MVVTVMEYWKTGIMEWWVIYECVDIFKILNSKTENLNLIKI